MYSHIPALCEEREIPYVFTPSRKHLGLAVGFARPFVAIMIKRTDENADVYDELHATIKQLDLAIE
jgi:H/ACA ribonucleoprotein complex subunit 2